jgi:hypothetical protein
VERMLAIVESMRRDLAEQLALATDPNIHWNCSDQFLKLTCLRLILLAEQVEKLEKELTDKKLNEKYKKTS